MKVSPEQYAQVLAETVKENNISDIAKTFWYKLQKNGQYKDMPKIILALDKEYARLNDKVLVQVYSDTELDSEQMSSLEQKIAKKYSSSGVEKNKTKVLDPSSRDSNNIILRNIIQKDIIGIIVKIDDTEIDLSLENKIDQLKQALNKL